MKLSTKVTRHSDVTIAVRSVATKKPRKLRNWKDVAVQREHLLHVGRELGVREMEDWYKVPMKEVSKRASFLGWRYGTLHKALSTLLPEYKWDPLRFASTPQQLFKDVANQKHKLELIGKQLGVKELDDWYKFSGTEIAKKATFIYTYYNRSLLKTLQSIYPEHNWDPSKFVRVPADYWNDDNNQRSHLESVGKELGIKELDDWYKVSATEISSKVSFLKTRRYNGSLYTALKKLYPHHNWDPTKFSRTPQGHWSSLPNQKEFLDGIGKKLGVQTLDDWYKFSSTEVYNITPFIKSHYRGSLLECLRNLYPEHNWDPLKFARVPHSYWNDEVHQRERLDAVGRELGVKELNDWYKFTIYDVRNKLPFITSHYQSSLRMALERLHPEHNWDPEAFSRVPGGYWNSIENQRDRLNAIGVEFGVKELDDWYKISSSQVCQKAPFIQTHYGASLHEALQNLFPEHNWDPIKFVKVPRGFWKDPSTPVTLKAVVNDMIKKYNISELVDWNHIPQQQFATYKKIAKYLYGGQAKLLQSWYPNRVWADDIASSSAERKLRDMLKSVTSVSVHHVIEGYSVDVYLPEFSVAIEYQGAQHFTPKLRGEVTEQQQRDREKRAAFEQLGIHLVEIPYWWNGSWSQLLATMKKQRPLQGTFALTLEIPTTRSLY